MKTAKLGIYMMLLLLAIGLAQAAANITCTVGTPASSATIDGKCYNISLSLAGTRNATSCTAFLGSSALGTDNTSDTGLSTSNFTCIDTHKLMFDSTTYSVTAFCTNMSEASPENATCTSSTGVLSDNTNPTPLISSPADGSTNKQKFAVAGTCSNCSSATLWLDSNSYALTLAGSAGSETFSYTFATGAPPEKGYNNVYVTAEDLNSDSVSSSPIKWIVSENSMAAKTAYARNTLANQEQQQQQYDVAVKQSNTTMWIVIGVVVSVALYFAFRKK